MLASGSSGTGAGPTFNFGENILANEDIVNFLNSVGTGYVGVYINTQSTVNFINVYTYTD